MEKISYFIAENNEILFKIAVLILFVLICLGIAKLIFKAKKIGIFLSYSHSNEAEMSKVKKILFSASSYEVYDFDSISVGQDIQAEIKRMIDVSKLFVVLFDENYIKSSYCSVELEAIISSGKPIIPIVKSSECVSKLPDEISKLKYLVISDDVVWEKIFERSLNKQCSQLDKPS